MAICTLKASGIRLAAEIPFGPDKNVELGRKHAIRPVDLLAQSTRR
jgi:hypothetical protein